MSRNMDQKRASFALGLADQLDDEKLADELKSQSAKFIALIVNSGFLQAMDFFCNNNNTRRTYSFLQQWFAQDGDDGPGVSEVIRNAAAENRLNQILAGLSDRNEYRRAMQEAVAFLGWLKSKAEGRKNEIKADAAEDPAEQQQEE